MKKTFHLPLTLHVNQHGTHMKLFYQTIGLVSCIISGGCAVPPPDESSEKFSINSREWLSPSLQDINANVQVERIGPNVYSLNYKFSIPLDPLHGTSPTAFHLFTFCVAGNLAYRNNLSHWAIGSTEKDMKYRNTKEIEVLIALVNKGQQLPTVSRVGKPVHWVQAPTEAAALYDTCSRMLRKQYMWPKGS